MNKLNIKKAIAVMERVEADGRGLDMHAWQQQPDDCSIYEAKTTYEEFHNCGTVCCFAGYVAVSPEFQADGGWTDKFSGRPEIVTKKYPDNSQDIATANTAIKHWLDISSIQAASLCGMSNMEYAYPDIGFEHNFDVAYIEIPDVLKALHSLHDTGKLPGE